MKCIKIKPNKLSGSIKIPPSKSLSHRAVICASLADGISNIENIILSDDITATCTAMEKLGAKIKVIETSSGYYNLEVNGGIKSFKGTIDCVESGSTIRFLIPISLINESEVIFEGRGRLVKRPIAPYIDIFNDQNIAHELTDGGLPLWVSGKISSGDFSIPGDISSQFISGLMFTLPVLKEDSTITITTELESRGYVDLTQYMLEIFGVNLENENYEKIKINGRQVYTPANYYVEGDYSQAAFWLVAGLIGDSIKCTDLRKDSLQGDKDVLKTIKNMAGSLTISENNIITNFSNTKASVIDASQCPDVIPVLTVLAALSEGTTKIVNGERLRLKESDRIKAICTELNKIGANIIELPDGLVINGVPMLNGGEVDSWNDHRIAMALAIASIRCFGTLTITNSACVKKSYPSFWEDFKSLGGDIDEFERR